VVDDVADIMIHGSTDELYVVFDDAPNELLTTLLVVF